MVRTKHPGAAATDPAVVPAANPPLPILVITRADRGTWYECCARLGLDPRARRVRYVTIDAEGIHAHISRGEAMTTRWTTLAGA